MAMKRVAEQDRLPDHVGMDEREGLAPLGPVVRLDRLCDRARLLPVGIEGALERIEGAAD
jgi:hypothetical protein